MKQKTNIKKRNNVKKGFLKNMNKTDKPLRLLIKKTERRQEILG